jgi:hypothetical protein
MEVAMGEILIVGPGRDGGWRPTYEPSSERVFNPQAARPIVVYRFWQLRRYRSWPAQEPGWGLFGIHPLCPSEWRERTVVAYCLSRPIAGRASQPESAIVHDTPAPERGCTCGVSAFYEPLSGEPGVTGVVVIWGRTILHNIWLRAETARVECLALGSRVSAKVRSCIEELASAWEIPIIGASELGVFARGVGEEVPKIARPAPRP